jgi:hypothetical protein
MIVTVDRFVEKIELFAVGRGLLGITLALSGPRGRGGPLAPRVLRLRGAQHVRAQDEAAQCHRPHLLPAWAGPREGGQQTVVVGQRASRPLAPRVAPQGNRGLELLAGREGPQLGMEQPVRVQEEAVDPVHVDVRRHQGGRQGSGRVGMLAHSGPRAVWAMAEAATSHHRSRVGPGPERFLARISSRAFCRSIRRAPISGSPPEAFSLRSR